MSIYIISNREVAKDGMTFKDKGKEKVDEAQPIFRIAKCKPDHGQKRVTYKILEDELPFDYSKVTTKLEAPKKSSAKLKGSNALFYDLYKKMVAVNVKDKCSDVLVFIPGYANSFKDNLKHIYELYKLYIRPDDSPVKHLIYISYPTRNHKILTYWSDQKDAEATGRIIGRLYEKTQNFFFQLFELTDLKPCKLPERKLQPLFEEIILLHADVDHDLFEPGKAFSNLDKIANRVHLYIHKSDFALRISQVTKNRKKRLGRRGPSNRAVLNEETIVIDVSENDNSVSAWEGIIDHWGYLRRGEEIEDIKGVLAGTYTEKISGRGNKEGHDYYYYV